MVHPGGDAVQLRRADRLHRELLDVRPWRRLSGRERGDGRVARQDKDNLMVIGLMVSSAKSTYDQANGGVTQIGAKVILLN